MRQCVAYMLMMINQQTNSIVRFNVTLHMRTDFIKITFLIGTGLNYELDQ